MHGGPAPTPETTPHRPAAEKPLLRFITCGSVDDGKSTLIGRMLYDAGLAQDDLLETLEKDSKKHGTQGEELDFALLVDGLAAEREQGITIDVAYRYFATDKRKFIVADTPGHEQYTRNMATGASTADLAVLLVDARKGILGADATPQRDRVDAGRAPRRRRGQQDGPCGLPRRGVSPDRKRFSHLRRTSALRIDLRAAAGRQGRRQSRQGRRQNGVVRRAAAARLPRKRRARRRLDHRAVPLSRAMG